MKELEIRVQQLDDGGVVVENLPVGDEEIVVRLRALTRRDRSLVQKFSTDDDSEEKLQALLITQFGDRDGVTSQELQDEKYDLTSQILGDVIT
ncbi:MAG: hypothetical protein F6K28_40740, partial [Microcoleus sp. SIO2G3]|nr:hypothetical protein [Microcoleus sp. SIO2G3]